MDFFEKIRQGKSENNVLAVRLLDMYYVVDLKNRPHGLYFGRGA